LSYVFPVAPEERPGSIAIEFITDIFEGTCMCVCIYIYNWIFFKEDKCCVFDCLLCVSAADKPSVAAIDGLTKGGGLEISMVYMCCHFFWTSFDLFSFYLIYCNIYIYILIILLHQACHARISTPTVQIAAPEQTIGLIPGFGGMPTFPFSLSFFFFWCENFACLGAYF
jgi:hypothetical protein